MKLNTILIMSVLVVFVILGSVANANWRPSCKDHDSGTCDSCCKGAHVNYRGRMTQKDDGSFQCTCVERSRA